MVHPYRKSTIRRVKSLAEDQEDLRLKSQKVNYESAIKGTTLDVYFYLLRKKESAGVREIQRALGLSSPSVSSYHLEKLENLEVVRKNRFGNYEIAKKLDIGALNQFIIVGNYTVPRFFFYAVFLTVFFGGYLLLFLTWPISTGEFFAILFGFIATIITWIEAVLSWRNKPF